MHLHQSDKISRALKRAFVSFHANVDRDLKKRKADVVELYQPLSTKMQEIQTGILECMEATLSEIKRSNTYVSKNQEGNRSNI